jgi:hypothetical protein
MAGCCICNFFKRTVLYQVLIIIAALKLKNAFRYNKEFVERIKDFLSSINLPENLVNYLPDNKEYTHKGFLITLIVLASFSILGVNFFKFLSVIGCLLLAFLYHNPIYKIKELFAKKVVFNYDTILQNLPDLEFVLYVCIALAMFGNAFKVSTCPTDKDKDDKEKEPLEDKGPETTDKGQKKEKGKNKQQQPQTGKNKGGKGGKKKKKD